MTYDAFSQVKEALAEIECHGRAALKTPEGSPVVCGPADVATLRRAQQAIAGNETAWLGFKLVTDKDSCLMATVGSRFAVGSANADSFLFFSNADGELVCGHDYSERDRFQMLDVTRGPSMHTGEFAGLDWASAPLKKRVRVVVFGAGEVSRYLADFAHAVDFETLVVDDDPDFLNPERFPASKLVYVDFSALDSRLVGPNDFVCVLTRNHTYDVEALACALKANPAYVGMIGHPDKIKNNYEVLRAQGIAEEAIARVHAPIGIKCGGRTPAEIAVSIVAQLIQERRG